MLTADKVYRRAIRILRVLRHESDSFNIDVIVVQVGCAARVTLCRHLNVHEFGHDSFSPSWCSSPGTGLCSDGLGLLSALHLLKCSTRYHQNNAYLAALTMLACDRASRSWNSLEDLMRVLPFLMTEVATPLKCPSKRRPIAGTFL
jgi:hypothetical protein